MLKSKEYFILKNNLKIILNQMIPGDKFMPSFSNAVKIEIILKKNEFILQKKRNLITSRKS